MSDRSESASDHQTDNDEAVPAGDEAEAVATNEAAPVAGENNKDDKVKPVIYIGLLLAMLLSLGEINIFNVYCVCTLYTVQCNVWSCPNI